MTRQPRFTDEHGAIIIHVAIALIALLAFTAFVVDHGLLLSSRRQAQNAADSGALAGAIGLIRDGGEANAKTSAYEWVSKNYVWGQPNSSADGGNVVVTFSKTGIPSRRAARNKAVSAWT